MAKGYTPEIPGLFDDLPEEAPQEQIATISFRSWRTHLASIRTLDKRIEKLIDEAVKQVLAQGRKLTSADIGRVFQRHPELRAALDKTMQQLNDDLTATIEQGSKEAWLRADTAADEVVAAMAANNDKLAELLNEGNDKPQNKRALRAFQQREMQGLKLSDRVWKATEGMKLDMERAIEVALAEGVPAQKLSERVRELLKEPHRLYRRVRDKNGNLKLSQAAQKYHPGTGVYRSSYKNAMRVARTEVNMAYQASNSERWAKSWWVKGIRVSLSNNHTSPDSKGRPAPLVDICDTLAGEYPSDFQFTGWHPQCRCFATAITCEYSDIREYYRRKRTGEDMSDHTPPGTIAEPPEQFKRWMADNKDRLDGATRRGTTPYFIANNAKYTDPSWKPSMATTTATGSKTASKLAAQRETPTLIPKEKLDFIQRFNSGEFKDDNAVIAHGKTHNIGSDYYPEVKYTKEQQDAIGMWQDEGDVYVHMLQEGKKFKRQDLKAMAENLRNTLEDAMDVYTTDRDMIVYRVVRTDYKYDRRDYFVSVSTSPEKVGIFGAETKGAQIQAFFVPKGTRCIVVGNDYQNQFELIFNSKDIDFESAKINTSRTIVKKTPLQIADDRHARRTAEEAADIQFRWSLRRFNRLNAMKIPAADTGRYNTLYNMTRLSNKASFNAAEFNTNYNIVMRHSARTPEQAQKIRQRWDARYIEQAGETTQLAAMRTAIKLGEITGIEDVERIMQEFYAQFPEEFNNVKIKFSSFDEPPKNGKFTLGRTRRDEKIAFNSNKGFGRESPLSTLVKALDKVRTGKKLSLEQHRSMCTVVHELLHQKAGHYVTLKPHGAGDYKRTAMETMNELAARATTRRFLRRIGANTDGVAQLIKNGDGYDTWVKRVLEICDKAGINPERLGQEWATTLTTERYDTMDAQLYAFIKKNADEKGFTQTMDEALAIFEDESDAGKRKWRATMKKWFP